MSDIMRRLAMEEPMTVDEQDEADYCLNNLNLYSVLNAAFALAEREGLILSLNLRRPAARKKAKKRS